MLDCNLILEKISNFYPSYLIPYLFCWLFSSTIFDRKINFLIKYAYILLNNKEAPENQYKKMGVSTLSVSHHHQTIEFSKSSIYFVVINHWLSFCLDVRRWRRVTDWYCLSFVIFDCILYAKTKREGCFFSKLVRWIFLTIYVFAHLELIVIIYFWIFVMKNEEWIG